jgi:AAA family ATP:ADP antiporter
MADLWNNQQGRRLFGFIAAGGSAGALAGPVITASLVGWLGPVRCC